MGAPQGNVMQFNNCNGGRVCGCGMFLSQGKPNLTWPEFINRSPLLNSDVSFISGYL